MPVYFESEAFKTLISLRDEFCQRVSEAAEKISKFFRSIEIYFTTPQLPGETKNPLEFLFHSPEGDEDGWPIFIVENKNADQKTQKKINNINGSSG